MAGITDNITAGLKFPRLFEPIRLGRATYRNRIFSAPQDTYRLTPDNFLDTDATAFYELKSRGGFAAVCVGDFIVDARAGHSHPFQLNGDDARGRGSLTRTASAILRHGAVASVELNHAGKHAGIMAEREGFVYGVTGEVRADGVEIREMDDEWIERLIAKFADGAAVAKKCGFGHITLHGGHGWLLAQFMSPLTNTRRDKWGGSHENRMRFPLAVLEAVRRAVGNGTPIEVRFSAEECVPGGYALDEGLAIARTLDRSGLVDLLHVSAGHHEDDAASMVTHPPMFAPDGVNVRYAREIKKHVKTPVAAVGALTEPQLMEELLAEGAADVLALGRQTLADPDLPLKARTGQEDEINRCLRCYTCFSTNVASGIFYCATNPVIGSERESLVSAPASKRQRVLIVGGGVAGMQAALTAARRGHEVILCEQSERLGGILLIEEHVPFKSKLADYLARQARLVRRAGVEVRLNTRVTAEYARSVGADAIIAAIGAVANEPTLNGEPVPRALRAVPAYRNPELVGETAVIVGGGLVGLELAIHLSQQGKRVTVVEIQAATIATQDEQGTSERISNPTMLEPGANIVHGIALAMEIRKLPRLEILTSTTVVAADGTSVTVRNMGGTRVIPAETLIYATGYQPRADEAYALRECAPEFYAIGDCVSPRNIQQATQQGYQIARDIGRLAD
ncbi:MAG: FAD-dependent oxidoreductase [Oscillospiraceae bacterium]|jgi:2,4-dienoyl-CoA reductase-like NADH-dependent reductase (Old Yellow Enzyme family)/thioredoxin reductase|nr:FAD-dependent oxidoreductase [Oscillospiraceae bacterium]